MASQFFPYEFGHPDGTLLSEEAFFAEHSNIRITPAQKSRLLQNLENQCFLVLKRFQNTNRIILYGFYQSIIFKDAVTNEYYLRPLNNNLHVFFRIEHPVLLIYDMKLGT